MTDPTALDETALREWIAAEKRPQEPGSSDRAALIRTLLEVARRGDAELPIEVLSAAAVLLQAGRSELDRLELDLMRAASDGGHNWSMIAQVFGYRSKQAAHARASALVHRLEYRTESPGDQQ